MPDQQLEFADSDRPARSIFRNRKLSALRLSGKLHPRSVMRCLISALRVVPLFPMEPLDCNSRHGVRACILDRPGFVDGVSYRCLRSRQVDQGFRPSFSDNCHPISVYSQDQYNLS